MINNKDLSRRQFLKNMTITTTGAIAAPQIITSTALGRGSIPPASDRITLGHIGVGGQGGGLLNNFLKLNRAQSIAVCDVFQSRREQKKSQIDAFYAEKYGKSRYDGCTAVNDFRELLGRDDIDAVVVATPDHWHVPIAVDACRAGKDMYVEKPLGVSVEENKTLRQTVRAYHRIFQYGTQQRSSMNFRYACELVRNGRIGDLQTIHVWCPGMYAQEQFHEPPTGSMKPVPVPADLDYDLWLGPAPDSPYTDDRCTCWGTYYHYDNSLGFIAGWGAHPLDIAQWGNNSDHTAPIEYEGAGTIVKNGLYNVVKSWDFYCLYQNGVKMHFSSDDIAESAVRGYRSRWVTHGTTFFGTTGWVSVDRAGIYAEPPTLLKSKIQPHEIHLYESINHYQNFVDCVRTRQQPISTIDAAVQSDIISHMCDIAIRLNQKVKWDPVHEIIVDNDRANRLLSRPGKSPWRL